jgi:hypothetical protein
VAEEIIIAGVEIIPDPITIGEITTTTRTEATARRLLQTKDGTRMETWEVAGVEARSHHQTRMGEETSSNRHRIKTLAGGPEIIISLTIKAIPDGAMATSPMTKTTIPLAGAITIITPTAITTLLDGAATTTINQMAKVITLAGVVMTSPRIKETLVGAMTTRTPAPVGITSPMIKEARAGATMISQTTKATILGVGAITMVRTTREIALGVAAVTIVSRMVKATAEAGIVVPIPMTKITTLDGAAAISLIAKETTIPMDGAKTTTPVTSQTAKEITTLATGVIAINPMVKTAIPPIGARVVTTENPKALEARSIALTAGELLLRRPGLMLLKAPRIMATAILETIGTVEATTTRGAEVLAIAGAETITLVVEILAGAVTAMITRAEEVLAIIGTVEERVIRAVEILAGEVAMVGITTREEVMDGEITKTTTQGAVTLAVVIPDGVMVEIIILGVEILATGVAEETTTRAEVMDGQITTQGAGTLAGVIMAGAEMIILAATEVLATGVVETTIQGVATLDGEVTRERNLKVAGEARVSGMDEVESHLAKLAVEFWVAGSSSTWYASGEGWWVGVCKNSGPDPSCDEVLDRYSVIFFGTFA